MSPPDHRTDSPRDIFHGILFMIAGMGVVPVMDVLAKVLAGHIPALEVSFARFFFQALITMIIALVWTRSLSTLRPQRWGVNLLRGALLSGATLAFFTALKVMPVADAIAIFFVEPMILTALSAVILKETVGPRRWAAVGVGLVGAMLIVRPSFAAFGASALLPLVTATLFAFYLIITRKLAGEDSLLSMQFTTALGGGATLGVVLLVAATTGIGGFALVVPGSLDLLMMVAIGLISFISHGFIVRAFALAPASVLAPFNYLEIVSATLLGYLVFRDFPDLPTWGGIALIVASGLYIAHRERLRAAQS
ncbi:DMT family transporter [Pannonibacter sp.]|uniref:DMT family transporter n=1 Tax=Pannonibacter sp. TaxID=1906786 RepID=UPI003F72D297